MRTEAAVPLQSHRTLLACILGIVTMLFTAFAAAYLEREAAARSWQPVRLPALVWLNTAVLLASSVTVEVARRTGRRGWLGATLVLGALFLAGQVAAWFALRSAGVFLSTSAHGSFFYVLTAVHGVHVVGGLIALLAAARRPAALGLCAGYWHFMGLVWLYVLFVLMVL